MTSVVSPYRGPVTTGKPGIRLVLSSFGFSQSPLPALCRQVASCAWRPRLRKIPDRRVAEASAGGHLKATWATQTAINRNRSRFLGRPWRPRRPKGNPRGAREPSVDARQTLRTVWFGRQVCAKPYKSLCILHIQPTCEK